MKGNHMRNTTPAIPHEVAVAYIRELAKAHACNITARLNGCGPVKAQRRLESAVRNVYRALTNVDPTPNVWREIVEEL